RSSRFRRLLEVALRCGRRGERFRSFTGADERQPGPPLDLGRVDRVGVEPVGLDEVRRDDLGQLVLGRRGGEMLGGREVACAALPRSEEHTSELQSPYDLVCRLLLEKKKNAAPERKHPPT